jgi:hypothetical protein
MGTHFLDALLGAIFGGLVTIGITIWVERLRSPQVGLAVLNPAQIAAQGPFQNNWRSLRVSVSNEPLPAWANWWMVRSPAQQCRARISFLRLDGTRFFEQPMIGRWAASSPQPKVAHVVIQGQTVPVILNPEELKVTADIYPGDSEPLDVAIRVDQEVDAYGWNNETYFYQNWRNPQRKLNHERYLVEVIVTSSGSKRRGVFRLDNDGPFTDFHLAELTLTQRQAVGVS